MIRLAVGLRRSLACVTVSLVAVGCGGKSTPTQSETPSIKVSISPTSASVEQGASTDLDVTVTGSGGFSGAATISLQSAPGGVTGTVSDRQTTGGNTTATLTIDVAATVSPDSYDLIVRATGSGVSASEATFALTVTAAPSYDLSVTPDQLMIEQGDEGTTDVAISRTNFTGGVTLAVEDAPAGMTASFDANPVSGTAAVLTLAVEATVATGTYTLTIRGTTGDLADRTVTMDVMVTSPATPDYMLGVTPSTLTIEQGSSQDADVAITRSNFTESVTLAAEGVPTAVAVAFSDNPVSGTTSTMTVTVAPGVAAGSYSFTLRGTATGLADKTVTVNLMVEEASSYALTLSPTSTTIDQAASGTVDVTLTRTNFTEEVDLSLENAPAGVTGTFSLDPVSGDASVLTIDVGASVPANDYMLTVRGTTASLSDQTATLTLTVAAAQGFSLESVAPISVEQGSSGVRTVTITRSGGFTGDVTVTVTDLPAGITASVDPVTTSGTSVDVTINVAGTVTVGNYTGTVRGNATGFPEDTQTLEISVLTAAGQQVSLDFSVCTADQRPIWLAYQDGAGPWTPVSGVGNTYTFNVASATAAVAVATVPDVGQTGVFVLYATQSELVTGDLTDLCDFVTTGKTVEGTVAGLNVIGGEGAYLNLGDAITQIADNGAFSIIGVPDGNLDLVGYKWSLTGTTDRMMLMRDLEPAPGSDIGTIDFAGGSAFDPASATITVQGGASDGYWSMEYATSPSTGVCYYASLDDYFYTGGAFTARGAPVAQQQSGDFHVVTLTDGVNTVSEMFAQLQNRTISYGAALPTPTVSDISGSAAYRRARVEVTLPAEYNSLTSFAVADDAGDHSIAVLATADWLGGLSITLEIPDFTGLAGWDDAWAPTKASTSNWLLGANGWTGEDCAEGAREVSTVTTGTVG